jgi:hypothetical protein
MWFGQFHGFHHFGFGFADTHAADGVSVEFHSYEGFGALFAQGRVAAALHNAENQLAIRVRLLATFLRPTDRPFNRMALILWGGVIRRTFVECHGDV